MSNIVLPHTWVPLEIPTAANFNAVQEEIRDKFNTYAFQLDGSKTMAGDLKFTDALYDIGKVGATRPRDGFFSRNVTVGDRLLMNTTVTAASGVGEIILANSKAIRGVEATAIDSRALIQLNADNRIQVGQDLHSVYLPLVSGGGLLLGTTVTTNSESGDIILKNSRSVRGVNAAGNDTFSLVRVSANDHCELGGNTTTVNSGLHIRIKQQTTAQLPAASAAADGLIIIDSTNGDLVFYKGGSRYKCAGLGF